MLFEFETCYTEDLKTQFNRHNLLTVPSMYVYLYLVCMKDNFNQYVTCSDQHSYDTRGIYSRYKVDAH